MAPKKKTPAGADDEADSTRLPDALPLEYLAAFMATEEANEEQQRSTAADRAQWAAEAYKRQLPLLISNEDVSKVLGGEWKNKVWTKKGVAWTPSLSVEHRAAHASKMHANVWACIKKVEMPAYHEWVGTNGKPPSGTQWNEVLKIVLEAVWVEKERQRIARFVAKEKKSN